MREKKTSLYKRDKIFFIYKCYGGRNCYIKLFIGRNNSYFI